MSYSLNKAQVLGYLGQDPEMKYTQAGTAVTNFSIATTRGVKRGDEWTNETEWHRIVAWDSLAERCSKELHKGSRCMVEGRIQTRSWVSDQDNTTHYITEIVIVDMIPLDNRSSSASGDDQEAARPQRQKSAAPRERASGGPPKRYSDPDEDDFGMDGDIPFMRRWDDEEMFGLRPGKAALRVLSSFADA